MPGHNHRAAPASAPVFPLSMFQPVHLGIDENVELAEVDLAERNMLLGGESGAGKSKCCRSDRCQGKHHAAHHAACLPIVSDESQQRRHSDAGESVNTLLAGSPSDAPQPPILPPKYGFLFLDRDEFHASFAADLPAGLAAFMADSQVPWTVDALGGQVTQPAWRTKPSWYLITTEDRVIPPAAQCTMSERTGSATVEVAGSHSIYMSQPDAVADLIKQATAVLAAQH